MAEHMSLNIGDVVTHEDWPEGETRTIIHIVQMTTDPRGDRLADGPRYCVFDKPAFAKGHISYSEAEDAVHNRWMEAGLEKVTP